MIDTVRRAQIIRLLETRDDHLPQPRRGDDSSPGFVHDKRARTCPDCLANGKTMKGCETCGGSGAVTDTEAIAIPDVLPGDNATKDPYAEDKPAPYGQDGTRHDRGYARNAEIARLEQQTRRFLTAADELADANKHPYRWEDERKRKWRDFDYAALDLALELLRATDQGGYHMLHAVYVYGWQDISVVVEAAVERGLRFLDERMPVVIRSPRADDDEADPVDAKDSLHRGKRPQHDAARERRVARVLRAHVEWGWSTEQIAAHESLSRRRVQQLLAEHAGVDAAVASGPAA